MVVVLKEVCRQEREEVRLLKRIVEREQQNNLSLHEHLVEHHSDSVRSIRSRANTAEITAVVLEERLQAIYDRCSTLDRHVGERPERLRKRVKGETKAVEAYCAHFMGDRFGHRTKDLIQFWTEEDELFNVSLKKLRGSGVLPRPPKSCPFNRWSILALTPQPLLI